AGAMLTCGTPTGGRGATSVNRLIAGTTTAVVPPISTTTRAAMATFFPVAVAMNVPHLSVAATPPAVGGAAATACAATSFASAAGPPWGGRWRRHNGSS